MYRTTTGSMNRMNQLRYSYSYTLVLRYWYCVQLSDDLSIYRVCTYKYDSYWYEYKYRTAVSTVSLCVLLLYELGIRCGSMHSSDAILHSEAYYSSTELQYWPYIHLHTFRSETMSKCQKYWKIGHNAKSIAGIVSTAQLALRRPDHEQFEQGTVPVPISERPDRRRDYPRWALGCRN